MSKDSSIIFEYTTELPYGYSQYDSVDITYETPDTYVGETTSIDKILEERSHTHGEFSDIAYVTQSFKDIMKKSVNYHILTDIQKEGLEMIIHKVARVLCGDPNVKDHYDDIAGYAKLIADRLQGN